MFRCFSTLAVATILAAGSAAAETVYRIESGPRTVAFEPGEGLFYPSGIALDSAGTIYVSDTANHVIRRVEPDGRMTVVAGQPGVAGARDGKALSATFRYPHGLAADSFGNLYVADSGNGTIRLLRADGTVETFAGRPDEKGTSGGHRLEATFVTPLGLALDLTGELWISDYSMHLIRRIDRDGEVVTVSGIAGEPGRQDGDRTRATFHNPAGLALDAAGRLWVADKTNGLVRMVTRDGFVTTEAGAGGRDVHLDGAVAVARFNRPADLAFTAEEALLVIDSWSHTIRKIEGGAVTTVAGAPGVPGMKDGAGAAARFDHPIALAVAPDGTIHVVDMMNHAVREGKEEEAGPGRRRTIRR